MFEQGFRLVVVGGGHGREFIPQALGDFPGSLREYVGLLTHVQILQRQDRVHARKSRIWAWREMAVKELVHDARLTASTRTAIGIPCLAKLEMDFLARRIWASARSGQVFFEIDAWMFSLASLTPIDDDLRDLRHRHGRLKKGHHVAGSFCVSSLIRTYSPQACGDFASLGGAAALLSDFP